MATHDIVLSSGTAHRITRVFIYAALIGMAVVYLLPFIVVLLTSLKSLEEIRTGTILSLPRDPSFQSWHDALFSACIGINCKGLSGYFLNSVLMVVPAVVLSTAIGALNGFALTQFRFKGDMVVFAFLLFGIFLPLQVVLIPLANMLGLLGIANSTAGLVLVHVIYGIPFTTLFFRNFFVTVPHEITAAAKMDGAGFWSIFRRVILPISVPSIVVSFIWQFTNIWNDYLFAVTYTSGEASPVTVALYNMVGSTTGVKAYNTDMASVLLTAMPTLLVYVFAGRYFIRGLTAGAVK